jgi:hypothetical protein
MKTYIVTVEVHTIDLYEVVAEMPEEAMNLWQDGKLLRQELSKMEAEAIGAREKGGRT